MSIETATENKHEIKTRETRSLLLTAAETIFVRDGYEGAELGEIASLAGRTKGAIYAQFASKEDIFLALIEDRSLCRRKRMEILLSKSASVEGNINALRTFYLETAEDHEWVLLLLEFKLFALRHAESKKRLQKLYAMLIPQDSEKRYASLLGEAAKGRDSISRLQMVRLIFPMLSGLVLDARLESGISRRDIRKVAGRIFDALVADKSEKA